MKLAAGLLPLLVASTLALIPAAGAGAFSFTGTSAGVGRSLAGDARRIALRVVGNDNRERLATIAIP